MKTLDDLRQFYNTTLQADLKVLERKRKAVAEKLAGTGAVIAILALVILFFISRSMGGSLFPAIMFPLIIGVILFVFIASLLSKGYVREFKATIIHKIITFIDDNLTYASHRFIPKSTFMASEIFKTRPNRYKGDDYVSGKVGATQIEFSELHAEYESGSGKNRSRRTVFKGLFFIADFNKHFVCKTIVLPDTAEKLFGGFGKMFQAWNVLRGQLIKLEDPEFEKLFVVYGDDQIQARYILSTSLMERIVDFKRKTNRPVYLSFVGSKVFVAVSYTKNLFEPRLFRTILDFELVQEYFEDLQLAIGIVDDLNLNTRIWSKQ
ncbi:MAG: DUF3137 domain-containing protein [Planctomycetota bacterium]|jgi:hypothetical protein